jgi:hypothetical protein
MNRTEAAAYQQEMRSPRVSAEVASRARWPEVRGVHRVVGGDTYVKRNATYCFIHRSFRAPAAIGVWGLSTMYMLASAIACGIQTWSFATCTRAAAGDNASLQFSDLYRLC